MNLSSEQVLNILERAKREADIPGLERIEEYYLGKHAILERSRPKRMANEKAVTNWVKIFVDRHTEGSVGQVTYIEENDTVDLEPFRNELNKQSIDEKERELMFKAILFGRSYEFISTKKSKRDDDITDIVSTVIDPSKGYIIYDGTIEENKKYGVIWSGTLTDIDGKEYEEVIIMDDEFIHIYEIRDEEVMRVVNEGNESGKHFFGEVPMIEWKNDDFKQGEAEQIITLNDIYNSVLSDIANNIVDETMSLMVIKGAIPSKGTTTPLEGFKTGGQGIINTDILDSLEVDEDGNPKTKTLDEYVNEIDPNFDELLTEDEYQEVKDRIEAELIAVRKGAKTAVLPPGSDIEFVSKDTGLVRDALDTLDAYTDSLYVSARVPDVNSDNFGNPSGTALEAKFKPFIDAVNGRMTKFNSSRDERFNIYSNALSIIKGLPYQDASDMRINNEVYTPTNKIDDARVLDIYAQYLPEKLILEQIPFVDDVEEAIMLKDEEFKDSYESTADEYRSKYDDLLNQFDDVDTEEGEEE